MIYAIDHIGTNRQLMFSLCPVCYRAKQTLLYSLGIQNTKSTENVLKCPMNDLGVFMQLNVIKCN